MHFCENRARDKPMWGVYIPHFGQISVKMSVLGVLYPYLCTLPPCQISPTGRKPQNRSLCKLNNRHFALREMLKDRVESGEVKV